MTVRRLGYIGVAFAIYQLVGLVGAITIIVERPLEVALGAGFVLIVGVPSFLFIKHVLKNWRDYMRTITRSDVAHRDRSQEIISVFLLGLLVLMTILALFFLNIAAESQSKLKFEKAKIEHYPSVFLCFNAAGQVEDGDGWAECGQVKYIPLKPL